ncbi:MAG: TIGR01777 family protein [Bacteroidetes bacterium]|nr:TIGR01777 family protein [Bacteroidota bacterium]
MNESKSDLNRPDNPSVLITGGSGLIGRYLTSSLLEKGYKVSHLSRNANQFGKVRVFRWDPEKGILDPMVFEGVDYIVHLAGANIGEKRWTSNRKSEIVNSRIDSAKLLHKVISENNIRVKAFISASAVGYYGSVTSDKIFTENDPPANDFLGTVCRKWEESADLFSASGTRVVKIRTGVVMEKSDSALSKMMMPAKFGFLVQTGNGRQYMPWIHITDLCNIYLKAIEDPKMNGAFNAVSPQHVTHKVFVKTLGQVIGKPVFPVPVPGIILKAVLGEMSDVVLKGSRVSAAKITESGYTFLYSELAGALRSGYYPWMILRRFSIIIKPISF